MCLKTTLLLKSFIATFSIQNRLSSSYKCYEILKNNLRLKILCQNVEIERFCNNKTLKITPYYDLSVENHQI